MKAKILIFMGVLTLFACHQLDEGDYFRYVEFTAGTSIYRSDLAIGTHYINALTDGQHSASYEIQFREDVALNIKAQDLDSDELHTGYVFPLVTADLRLEIGYDSIGIPTRQRYNAIDGSFTMDHRRKGPENGTRSGEFEFTMVSENDPLDTLRISNGIYELTDFGMARRP